MNSIFFDILDFKIYDFTLLKLFVGLFAFSIFFLGRQLFARIFVSKIEKLLSKTKTDLDDLLFKSLIEPLKVSFLALGVFLFAAIIGHTSIFGNSIKSFVILIIFWSLFNFVKLTEEKIINAIKLQFSHEIGLFGFKTLKVIIIISGGAMLLQNYGVNISAFIASLGLGGLAFALAAKDSAANLFGGFAILTDKMFKIGDWIKIGDSEGVVEDIGMRTTKIRAFDKRLITVPNGQIANTAVNNFSKRNRRRIKMRLGLVYSTTNEQMIKILNEVRNMLQEHEMIHNDTQFVYFDEFGESELSLFFYLFTKTANWEEYLKIREDINLKIIDIVQQNGSDFAFPSNSIYIEKNSDNKDL